MTIRKDDTAKFKRQAIGLVVVGLNVAKQPNCANWNE